MFTRLHTEEAWVSKDVTKPSGVVAAHMHNTVQTSHSSHSEVVRCSIASWSSQDVEQVYLKFPEHMYLMISGDVLKGHMNVSWSQSVVVRLWLMVVQLRRN